MLHWNKVYHNANINFKNSMASYNKAHKKVTTNFAKIITQSSVLITNTT